MIPLSLIVFEIFSTMPTKIVLSLKIISIFGYKKGVKISLSFFSKEIDKAKIFEHALIS